MVPRAGAGSRVRYVTGRRQVVAENFHAIGVNHDPIIAIDAQRQRVGQHGGPD
jgi:hypothetical protein